MQVKVRRATPQDVDWIVPQLKLFAAFYNTTKSLFPSDEAARANFLNKINNHLVFVAECDERGLMGFISGYVFNHAYNQEIKVLAESFWWVPVEHRNTRAGALLLNAFMDWGKEHVDWITFALESESPIKEETLIKRGFHLQEKSYLMECKKEISWQQ